MQRIIYVSRFFRIAFLILATALPIAMLLAWINNPHDYVLFNGFLDLDYIPASYNKVVQQNILHGFTHAQKWRGGMVSFIPLLFQIYILLNLSQLFKYYAESKIFVTESVNLIKKIGIAFFISRLINPIYEALMGVALTWDYSKGHRYFNITITQNDIGLLFLPMLIILIAWIMSEGCKLQEENQLTI